MSRLTSTDLAQVARGMLMGGADIIPGVSGGTVALILGIYARLVTAISRFDLHLVEKLRRKAWTEAAEHIDLRFLISLGSGIALGILALASLMHTLLVDHMQLTYAVFSGLILASSLLVGRTIEVWGPRAVGLLVLGCTGAFWLVGLPFLQTPPDGLWYVFVCGSVGICAMILPGVSGAFVLLILGKYTEITGLLKGIFRGQIDGSIVLTLAVFCIGMAVGLICFSKILKSVLARFGPETMAVLCGLMLGSLRKLWPFKRELTPADTEFKLKQFENLLPDFQSGEFWLSAVLAVAAAAAVLILDAITRRRAAH